MLIAFSNLEQKNGKTLKYKSAKFMSGESVQTAKLPKSANPLH